MHSKYNQIQKLYTNNEYSKYNNKNNGNILNVHQLQRPSHSEIAKQQRTCIQTKKC